MAKGDDLLISANERAFILTALRENELRVDGRGPFDARPVSYRFGPTDGVCEVSLGQTRVLAVVSAKVISPLYTPSPTCQTRWPFTALKP
jgi:exosome complex component RRP45